MAFDKFLIAPMDEGLRRDKKPWLIPEEAFEELNNAYVFRGRVKKRFGSQNLGTGDGADIGLPSRLRINLGNTDGSGDITGTIPMGATPIGAVGQMFSVGTETFTIITAGAQVMITTGAATTHTFNTATGAYDIQGADIATACYFYPSTPVMGFSNYESDAINNEPIFAFDRNFAYTFIGGEWVQSAAGGAAAQWNSTDSEFFWGTTYRGLTVDINIMFVTNYRAADQMRYWNGATWTAWNPATRSIAGYTIESARIILPFQNRLVLLNTHEIVNTAAATFVNRCRYSQNGSPLAAEAYYEKTDTPGRGGFIDAPTKEAIVSAQILKNRLIVFFERSTYELTYTGVKDEPFIWQQINSTLGSESTFSIISFDKMCLGIGDTGIHACNGANVERIDAKIPDEVFKFHNADDGPARVHGVKDYYAEMVYWAIPNDANYRGFPNRVLAFNYKSRAWALFDDSITAFGYFWTQTGLTWAEILWPWEEWGGQWNDGSLASQVRYSIAGNQQGYTFIIARNFPRNAISLSINNITVAAGVVTITCINHNMKNGDWVYIDGIEDDTGTLDDINDANYKIKRVDDNNFTIDEPPVVAGTYEGSGVASLVSKIDIKTKQFNFYVNQGVNTYIPKVDFYVSRTENSDITVDYFSSSSNLPTIDTAFESGMLLGISVLEMFPYPDTLEETQDRFWHAVYIQTQGECIQLRLYWTDEQMKDLTIPFDDFELHGMLFHASPTQEL